MFLFRLRNLEFTITNPCLKKQSVFYFFRRVIFKIVSIPDTCLFITSYYHNPQFDPFLMLGDFHTSNPDEYLPGFPWHPHRGIETIAYLLEGVVEHGDCMGNKGIIAAGDVQWMTAGSTIIHQEIPQLSPINNMWGFQFWANLPASHKMIKPRYQDIKAAEIPAINMETGVLVSIISVT